MKYFESSEVHGRLDLICHLFVHAGYLTQENYCVVMMRKQNNLVGFLP